MININKNRIELIGKITSISYEKTDINGKRFMFFDVMQNGFYKVRLNEDLIRKYKNVIRTSNNIHIVGFLNSYTKDNKTIYYIFPQEIELLNENNELLNGKDHDGVEVFKGVRCESIPATPEEQKEMEDLLSEYR